MVIVQSEVGECNSTGQAEAQADSIPVIPSNEWKWCYAPYFDDPYLCSPSDAFSPPVSQGCPPPPSTTTTTLSPSQCAQEPACCAGNAPGSCQPSAPSTTTTTLPPAGDTSACCQGCYNGLPDQCPPPSTTTTTAPPETTTTTTTVPPTSSTT